MQPRRKSFLSTGITSIVLIFVLLCLLTFAVLSVVSARADYKLSEKNTTRTTEYYEAENTANDILLKISTVLSTHAGSSAYLDDVRTDLDGTDGISFSSASQLQYYVTINENQRLFVSLLLTNASSDTSSDTAGLYQIKAWKVENTHEWNNDTPVPVLGSDEMNELLSEDIDEINRTQEKHIITLEDPLEFLHRHKKSIVSQREISSDTESYLTALRASLRQSPDVILLGEMRDFETISVAMTAAETGHLVLSTLHTLGAANTIDRIIDVFPPNQQRQISVQLSSVLHAVVSQQLVPSQDGKLVPAFELMTTTSAIRNMIRENKIHQIEGLIYSSSGKDMMSMDNSLLALYKAGTISDTEALAHASNPDMLKRKL